MQPRDLAHPSPNFYRGSKSAKFGNVFNIVARLWVAHVWKRRYLISETNSVSRDDGRMSCPISWSLVHAPLRSFRVNTTPLKISRRSSITLQRIVWFCSDFTQSLNTWRPNDHKSSRSRGQRSRSQRDVTQAKICQIVNNSAGGCSISIKFSTDYDHVPSDLPQTFKVNGSKVKVIAWHDVLALKNRHISWTDSLTEFKLCANYPRA